MTAAATWNVKLRCCRRVCLPVPALTCPPPPCTVLHPQSTPLLDLNYMEDAGGGPDISVAVHPNKDRLVLLQVCLGVCACACRCLPPTHTAHTHRCLH
jgi:hypothetical protein